MEKRNKILLVAGIIVLIVAVSAAIAYATYFSGPKLETTNFGDFTMDVPENSNFVFNDSLKLDDMAIVVCQRDYLMDNPDYNITDFENISDKNISDSKNNVTNVQVFTYISNVMTKDEWISVFLGANELAGGELNFTVNRTDNLVIISNTDHSLEGPHTNYLVAVDNGNPYKFVVVGGSDLDLLKKMAYSVKFTT